MQMERDCGVKLTHHSSSVPVENIAWSGLCFDWLPAQGHWVRVSATSLINLPQKTSLWPSVVNP